MRLLTLGLTIACVSLLPPRVSAQGFGPRQENTSLNGTRLTYYPQPSVEQCQADCAQNSQCQGFTWIKAGTYNPSDAAMCYLLSAVTSSTAAAGHISGVNSASIVDADAELTIYYATVSCPNKCPMYSLTIRPDRSVEYEGKEHTRVLGKRTYTISAEAYQAIVEAVKRARVERLANEYKSVPGRDEGTVILGVSQDGTMKQIYHFLPSPDAPQELTELEEAIVKHAYPRQERAS